MMKKGTEIKIELDEDGSWTATSPGYSGWQCNPVDQQMWLLRTLRLGLQNTPADLADEFTCVLLRLREPMELPNVRFVETGKGLKRMV